MYDWNDEEKKVDFSHNPFSMPQGGLTSLEANDPLTIKAHQYDIVCNGYEIASGAIRNHSPQVMKKAFAIAGYEEAVLEARFGGHSSSARHALAPRTNTRTGSMSMKALFLPFRCRSMMSLPSLSAGSEQPGVAVA